MADFHKAALITFKNEGYGNDPHDQKTRWGIIKSDLIGRFANWDLDSITKDQALEIYKESYWDKLNLDQIESQPLATKVFDQSLPIGIYKAARFLQKALNLCGQDVNLDGKVGPHTIISVNKVEPYFILNTFIEICVNYYKKIVEDNPAEFKEYLNGWIARARQVHDGD